MNKINKRIKNAIIQGFVFNIVVALFLIFFLFSYILPNILVILEKQEELQSTVEIYEDTKKEGLTFKKFRTLYSKYTDKQDPYIINLLKNVDEDFYTQNLKNTTDGDYEVFLEEKNKHILSEKGSEEFKQRDEKVNTILPPYSGKQGIEGALSDYEFVNFIEALLFTFNLETEDSIGVWNVEPVKEGNQSKKDKETAISTETSIFYIPLQLKLVGQKKDILDFIHYLENVGSINIEDGQIVIHNDNVIKKSLEGDIFSSKYNIYKNQTADIEYIVMRDYIDASINPTDNDNLETFIKKTQWRDRFLIEVKIKFYVSGLPDYKVEKFIIDIAEKHEEITKATLKTISEIKPISRQVESGDVLFAINTINSLWNLLENMGEKVKGLRSGLLKDKSKIEAIYDEALEINVQLEQIRAVFMKNKNIIDTINK